VQLLDAGTDLVIVTRLGRAIRFPEVEVAVMGRVTQGVRGIQLREGDAVVGMVVVRRDATLCTVTEQGYAKRTPLADYPAQKRGGLGTITLDVTEKSGPLVAAKEVLEGDELMVIAASGAATRIRAPAVPVQGRATQGKRVIRLADDDRVVEVARVAEERDEDRPAPVDRTTDDGTAPGRRGPQLELMSD
jgi:DNA gyrase subunit A